MFSKLVKYLIIFRLRIIRSQIDSHVKYRSSVLNELNDYSKRNILSEHDKEDYLKEITRVSEIIVSYIRKARTLETKVLKL